MMRNFRNFLLFIVIFFSFFGQLNSATQSNAHRTFWHPTYLGERLNYCSVDGKECGREIANRYCQILGYGYSRQNVIAYNVGLTRFLGTKGQCQGWRCNGFMNIVCTSTFLQNPPKQYHYREKLFSYPRYNDYRVDWCYNKDSQCGSKAANSFCSRMGYIQAKQFNKQIQISATKTIGSEELCFGKECNAFKMILCSR